MDLQAFVSAGGAPAASAAPIRFLGTVDAASADVNRASINIAPAVATALPVCAAAVASARASKNTRRSRGTAGTAACAAQSEKSFAGGLIGGESAFSSFDYNFDPLKLSERGNIGWFREAELKHGRVAMLAWVGLVVPDFVRVPGDHPCYSVANVVEAHNVCAGDHLEGPLAQVLLWVGLFEFLTTFPKATFFEITPENAGDYKLGLNLLPSDPEKAKEMKLKELKNGRLAMLAFGGAITQATLTGGGFPWLYATGTNAKFPGLASSIAPAMASRSASRLTLRAESTGYKMSKSVPFLPVSPALEGYVGEEDGFDPIGISMAFDIRWLRESELKHGRVCMLATVGWITTDLGYRVPGEPFQISTIEAHNRMTEFGAMPQMLVWIFCAEIFGFLAITNMMEGTTDRKPGDFGIRLLYPKDPQGQCDMQLKELRNGRLAMLAFGGIVTQAVLTQSTWPFFAHSEDCKVSSRSRSSFCGAPHRSGRLGGVRVKAKETSASLPFMPKPKNLKGFVGEEQEFDPLGFSDRIDIRWLRESELKHGRVCMLATVGFVAQQYITFPGVAPCPDSLQAIYQAPPSLMASLIFAAGYIESTSYGGKLTVLDMFEDDRIPGDLNFGKRLLDGMSEKDAYQMKLKELQNGRLAMFALGGMVHHNLVVQGPLFPLFPEGWVGPQNTWKAQGALETFLYGFGPS